MRGLLTSLGRLLFASAALVAFVALAVVGELCERIARHHGETLDAQLWMRGATSRRWG